MSGGSVGRCRNITQQCMGDEPGVKGRVLDTHRLPLGWVVRAPWEGWVQLDGGLQLEFAGCCRAGRGAWQGEASTS